MTNSSKDILSDTFLDEGRISRKTLIPLWIKIFSWIFIVFGLVTPIVFILGIITHGFELSLYGLEATSPYSILGVLITILYIFKGIVAYGILKHENWAINAGVVDAVAGIVICVIVMVYPADAPETKNYFRLELAALIPYLIKFLKIKDQWQLARKK